MPIGVIIGLIAFVYVVIGALAAICCDLDGQEALGCIFFWPVVTIVAAVRGLLSLLRSMC